METQQGFTLWLTGMSGAGKSTLANYLAKRLPLVGRRVEVLDMSELGEILPEEPDSSREVRDRNVRQLGWMARVLTRNGIVPIVAAVSPYRELREEQRREIGRFFEIFVDCSFEVLMERDTKGIYRRALSGELQDVVGVQSPYEPPGSAEVKVDMGRGALEEVAKEVFDRMVNHGYLSRKERDILVNGSAPAKGTPKAKREAKIDAIRAAAKKVKKAAAAREEPKASKEALAAKGGEKAAAPAGAKASTAGAKAPTAKAAKAPPKSNQKAASSKNAAAQATAPKTAASKPAKGAAAKAAAPKAAASKPAKGAAAKTADPKSAASKPAKGAAAKAAAPKAAASKPVKGAAAKAATPKTAASKPAKGAAAKAAAPKAARGTSAKAAKGKTSNPKPSRKGK